MLYTTLTENFILLAQNCLQIVADVLDDSFMQLVERCKKCWNQGWLLRRKINKILISCMSVLIDLFPIFFYVYLPPYLWYLKRASLPECVPFRSVVTVLYSNHSALSGERRHICFAIKCYSEILVHVYQSSRRHITEYRTLFNSTTSKPHNSVYMTMKILLKHHATDITKVSSFLFQKLADKISDFLTV